MRIAALAAVALALAAPSAAGAAAGTIAVGVREGASVDYVSSLVAGVTQGVVDESLEALDALVVTVPDVATAIEDLQTVPDLDYVEPVSGTRSLAFEPNDPLRFSQFFMARATAAQLGTMNMCRRPSLVLRRAFPTFTRSTI